jgi:hypothetical protein
MPQRNTKKRGKRLAIKVTVRGKQADQGIVKVKSAVE